MPPPQTGVPRPHSLALHLVHCGCVDGEVASESGASCSPSPAASRAESPTPIGRSRRHATQRFSPPSGFCHAVGGSAILGAREGGLLRSAVGASVLQHGGSFREGRRPILVLGGIRRTAVPLRLSGVCIGAAPWLWAALCFGGGGGCIGRATGRFFFLILDALGRGVELRVRRSCRLPRSAGPNSPHVFGRNFPPSAPIAEGQLGWARMRCLLGGWRVPLDRRGHRGSAGATSRAHPSFGRVAPVLFCHRIPLGPC